MYISKVLLFVSRVDNLINSGTLNFAVKVKVNIKFTLKQATKAPRGSRGIALPFFKLGASWGWVINTTPRSLCPRERDTVPIV
jgi:hypothetical protein